MGPITYPDTSTLVSTALTISPYGGTLGAILQPLTMGMMGLTADKNSAAVRLEWATEGQPFQEVNEDVCYIRATLKDDPYDKIRDRTNTPGDDPHLDEQWNYTRVWLIGWIFYGPNAVDLARAVRSALYQDFFTDALGQSQLFPMSEIAEPLRVPEKIGPLWFERADLQCEMYEFVTEKITRQTVASAEVLVYDPDLIADISIPPPPKVFPPESGGTVPVFTELAADPFNRPDENPANTNWKSLGVDFAPGQVLNQQFAGQDGQDSEMLFDGGVVWPDDQYSQATLESFNEKGIAVLVVRATTGVTQVGDSYALVIDGIGAGGGPGGFGVPTSCEIAKNFNALGHDLIFGTVTPQPGDVFMVAIKGNKISCYQNGFNFLSVVDSDIVSGKPGIGSSPLNGVAADIGWKDWSGGLVG